MKVQGAGIFYIGGRSFPAGSVVPDVLLYSDGKENVHGKALKKFNENNKASVISPSLDDKKGKDSDKK